MKTELIVGNIRIHFESRARRRWFVTFFYALLAVFDLAWCSVNAKETTGAWIISGCMFLVVALVLILTSITGDVRSRGDEREMHRREHACFKAYPILGKFLLGALFASSFRGANPITPLVPLALRSFLMQLPYMLLMATGILSFTLPQAILLWTEPDMDENLEAATQ